MSLYVEHLPDHVRIACSVVDRGWPVLALYPGTKKPLHGGSDLKNHGDHWLVTVEEVVAAWESAADPWTGQTGCQFASITGQPNAEGLCLVALDVDVDGDWVRLDALLMRAGPDAIEWAATTLQSQRSPDRCHLWGVVVGPCPRTGDLAPGIEWRGDGGYVLLIGAKHPTGSRYAMARPSEPLPVPASLLNLARGRGLKPDPTPVEPVLEVIRPGQTVPGTAWDRVMEALGSRVARRRPDGSIQAHCPGPEHSGGDRNPSLSLRDAEGAILVHCFAGCGTEEVVEALGLSMADLFDDDEPITIDLAPLVPATTSRVENGTGLLDLTDWARTRRLPPRPKPALMRRTDGQALFYPGKVNGLYGPRESGKTWVAAAVASEELSTPEGRVAWIDLDFMEEEVGSRLILLGVDWSVVSSPDRVRIYAPMNLQELAKAVDDAVRWRASLAVVDSIGELMPMAHGDSNSPDEFTVVFRTFVAPLLETATVVTIDHTAKGANLGSGPTGTDAKGRPVRGAFLGVKTEGQRPAPGRNGALGLYLNKDTYGALRADADSLGAVERHGLTMVGKFELMYDQARALDDLGSLSWRIQPPDMNTKEHASATLADGTQVDVVDTRVRQQIADVAEHVRKQPGFLPSGLAATADEVVQAVKEGLIVEGDRCSATCPVCPGDAEKRGRHNRRHFFPGGHPLAKTTTA